jgi:hypothetical protein
VVVEAKDPGLKMRAPRFVCLLARTAEFCQLASQGTNGRPLGEVGSSHGCHADVFGRTDGRSDNGRGGVRNLDAL